MAIHTIKLGKVLITFRGEYVGGGSYEQLDVVTQRDSSYICILDAPSGINLTNTTYWKPLSLGSYDYAVKGGYTGTQVEFLEALSQAANNNANELIRIANENDRIEAEILRELAKQDMINATSFAQSQGEFAQTQGNYALEQGDYALEQGNYAKEQGDYALEQGLRAETAANDVENILANVPELPQATLYINEGQVLTDIPPTNEVIFPVSMIDTTPTTIVFPFTATEENIVSFRSSYIHNLFLSDLNTTRTYTILASWSIGSTKIVEAQKVFTPTNDKELISIPFASNLLSTNIPYEVGQVFNLSLSISKDSQPTQSINIFTSPLNLSTFVRNGGEIGSGQITDFNGENTKILSDRLREIESNIEGKVDKSDVEDIVTEGIDRSFKTLKIGAAGLVTLSPTTQYFTYRLNVIDNLVLNIDLQRMINKVGNARCRLIIDMPILKTITLTNPIVWGGTIPTFNQAGQYILEIIDTDGSNIPLIWQVAYTSKAQSTGVVLYVDGDTADYTESQINGETAARTTSTWAVPFKYLQNAINSAVAGDVIFVKEGTYYPTHLRSVSTYTDGDHLNRNATFTIKTGIDIYGGFKGTESRVWQRQLDEKGFPTNKTILSGDILREAIIDTNISVGDRRTAGSKANASYNVVYAAVTNYTYLNGFEIKFGNANGGGELDNGAGIYSFNSNLVNINNKLENHTATRGGWYRGSSFNSESSFVTSFGGGWYAGTNTNCTAYNNSAINGGGGWFLGTNTNCTAYNNSAINGGGGWRDGTNTNCTAYNNSASFGGGWFDGTNTNCTAYNNSATSEGGGWFLGTNTNCTAYSNSAINGGGWYAGTNSNCTAYSNSATYGGGWRDGNNTNCTAYSNSATYGGGWFDGNNTNCTAYSNSATVYGGGWYLGTNTNCTAYSNSATVNGGGWIGGNNTNCVGINNRGPNGVLIGTVTADSNINCLLFNNRNTSDVVVGFNDVSATSIKVFRNNAYDTMHPTITGAVGSDIDISTCLENVTLEQIKINVPTFVGNSTNETQINELKEFRENIVNNLRPKLGSILKGKGVNNVTYPNPTDFEGNERPTDSTIGILESE